MHTMTRTCALPGCDLPAEGEYDYCSFKHKIKAAGIERGERDAKFSELVARAHEAGMKAGNEALPEPMVVVGRAHPLDDTSPVTNAWYVSEGACGFAWVTVRPGNSSFAIWAKKHAGFRKAYYGGVEHWVSGFGQSMARKEAYARAYANVLREASINAYPGSRMD
jgi:hypothetical protein